MDIKEFDKWYDAEIEKIIKRLPDPNKHPNPTIVFPVNFSELHFLILIICHKIELRFIQLNL